MSLLNGHLGLVLMRNRSRLSAAIAAQYVACLRRLNVYPISLTGSGTSSSRSALGLSITSSPESPPFSLFLFIFC